MDCPNGAASRSTEPISSPRKTRRCKKRRARQIGGLALVQRVSADFLPRHHLLQVQPLELLVKIVDKGQAADAVGHPAKPRADIDFVDGLAEVGGVGPRIALAATSNQSVENVVQHRRSAATQAGEHQCVLRRADRIGRRKVFAALAGLLDDLDHVIDDDLDLAVIDRPALETHFVVTRRAVARAVARQLRDAEVGIGGQRDAERARGNRRVRLGIVLVQKDVESTANDHRLLGIEPQRRERLPDGLPHEAFAGQRTVGDQGAGIDSGTHSGAKKGHFTAQGVVGPLGARHLEQRVPRFVPVSVPGRLGQQAVKLAGHGDLVQVAAAVMRRGLGNSRICRRGVRLRQRLRALDGVMGKVDEDGLAPTCLAACIATNSGE